ncbi:hypothetical protein QUF70_18565 [Desulfobacterales bacterium HSG17]|nr:hypothetical protein [Desulfobacterales bacterium HSG17]
MKETINEKLIIKVTDQGVDIKRTEGENPERLYLTTVEALMLLDILQNEEKKLRALADAHSPLPLRFSF